MASGTGGSQEGRWQLGQEAVGVGRWQVGGKWDRRQVATGTGGMNIGGNWDRRQSGR